MKITSVETFTYWINWCNWLFVKIETDEGLVGWGEGSLHGAIKSVEAAIGELSLYLVGKDPSGVEAHWQAMYHAWRWRGGATLSTALGALDIALWDLEGKRLGVPVYRLLGGPFRKRLRVYASHWLTGATTPDQAFSGAQEAVGRGFSALKWSPFNRDRLRENEAREISRATDMMAAARAGAGSDAEIFVECGEQLSPRTAVIAATAFLPYRPGWFEEPIPFENAKAMIALQREMPVPIATGERLLSRWEFRELLEGAGCKIIQPDVMHGAGITEMRKIASMADMYYIPVAPHNPGGPICNLAAAHVAAAIPNFLILEQMENERSLRDELCTHPIHYSDGSYELSDRPGLGTDLNLEILRARAYKLQPISGSQDSLWR